MKVALVQQKYTGDKESMRNKSAQQIEVSAKNGAQLIVLQELHQTEYFCQSEDTKFFSYANSFPTM